MASFLSFFAIRGWIILSIVRLTVLKSRKLLMPVHRKVFLHHVQYIVAEIIASLRGWKVMSSQGYPPPPSLAVY